MKDSLLFAGSILLFFFIIILNVTLTGDSIFLIFMLPHILIGTLSISYFMTSWNKIANFREQFIKSLKYSFGISCLILLLGYLYDAIAPIIFLF